MCCFFLIIRSFRFLVIVFFDILDISIAISRKVLVIEAGNFYQLIDYN